MTSDKPPVIGFLTDFGTDGAAAVCRGVMLGICREAQIVDVSHTVRKYAIRDAAYIVAFALPYLPVGVHVAVVDPGVGTARRPIAVRAARGDVLIGPDNGLLAPAVAMVGGATRVVSLESEKYRLPRDGVTFDGRDVFAPAAAVLASGEAELGHLGPEAPPESLVPLLLPLVKHGEGVVDGEVWWVDRFGNAQTNVAPDDLALIDKRLCDATDQIVAETAFEAELLKFPEDQRDKLRAAVKTPEAQRTPEQKLMVANNPKLLISPGVLYQYNMKASDELKADQDKINAFRGKIPPQDFVSLLTEDRKRTGLCLNLPLATNITLANVRALIKSLRLQRRLETKATTDYIEKLRIRPPSPAKLAGRLSGGNQQKSLLARWLFANSRIFLLDEPTRGVDVAARADIYREINELAASGAAIVMVSSDLPELLGMTDRIVVMRRGRLVAEFDARRTTQEEILKYAAVEEG